MNHDPKIEGAPRPQSTAAPQNTVPGGPAAQKHATHSAATAPQQPTEPAAQAGTQVPLYTRSAPAQETAAAVPGESMAKPAAQTAENAAPARPKLLPVPLPLLLAALASYVLGYAYTFLDMGNGTPLLFALATVLGVECVAHALRRPAQPESRRWALCWLGLSAGLAVWGSQPYALQTWQMLVWHLFAVWYVLARCGALAQGYTGPLVWLDAVQGCLVPFRYLLRRIAVVGGAALRGLRTLLGRRAQQLLLTVGVTAVVCAVAWGQLAAASSAFAALGQGLGRWLAQLFESGFWPRLLLSLPVGAWLFGLLYSALRPAPERLNDAAKLRRAVAPLRRLPLLTVNVLLVALCGMYALFFGVSALEFARGVAEGLTAAKAAGLAVQGFWELCRVLLLNFAVLYGIRYLAPQAPPRALRAVFCAFGLAFVALAALQLGTYIVLYGLTLRRVVSAWFLAVLAVWAVLVLLRQFYCFGAMRLGIAVLAISFVLLSACNVKYWVARANIARYAAGVDARLDVDVLVECYLADEQNGIGRDLTQRLLDANWFAGRGRTEIQRLYLLRRSAGGDTATLPGGAVLCLRFDNRGRCTEARLTQP